MKFALDQRRPWLSSVLNKDRSHISSIGSTFEQTTTKYIVDNHERSTTVKILDRKQCLETKSNAKLTRFMPYIRSSTSQTSQRRQQCTSQLPSCWLEIPATYDPRILTSILFAFTLLCTHGQHKSRASSH